MKTIEIPALNSFIKIHIFITSNFWLDHTVPMLDNVSHTIEQLQNSCNYINTNPNYH